MYLTPEGSILVLRSSDPDRRSHGGFQWPESGPVEAPDWDPDPSIKCGHGLHGLPWGQGDVDLTSPHLNDRIWQVVQVHPDDLIPGRDKARFHRGTVILSTSDRHEPAALLASHNPPDPVPFHHATGQDARTGPCGTATAGRYGTATAGFGGEIRIRWYDSQSGIGLYRTATAYPGEQGILPDTPYRLDNEGRFIPA